MAGTRAFLLCIALLVAGCAAGPGKAVFNTDESQLEMRSYQSRVFESRSEIEMIRDVIDTMQDFGFQIENADARLGTVTGSRFAAGFLGGPGMLTLTVTVRPRGEAAVVVRANAQRGRDRIDDPEIYQAFFNALQQAGFISAGRVD